MHGDGIWCSRSRESWTCSANDGGGKLGSRARPVIEGMLGMCSKHVLHESGLPIYFFAATERLTSCLTLLSNPYSVQNKTLTPCQCTR